MTTQAALHRALSQSQPPLPETVTYDLQPYGCVTLGSLSWGSYNGHPCIHGIVTKGTTTNRLFQHTSKVDATGEHRTIYGVRDDELMRGHFVRIAM